MKTIKQTMILSALVLVVITGCKKYEEGPGLSLRSKSARASSEWKINYAFDYIEQKIKTEGYEGETWELTKEGKFAKKDSGIVEKSGNWMFIANKDSLQFSFESDMETFQILKLKENEMWLKDAEEELHLMPAQ